MRIEKKKKKQDSGLPLAIFAQPFPRRSEEQEKCHLSDLLTYALLHCNTDGAHRLYIYRLGQGLSNMIEKCLVVHSHPTPIPPLSTWTNNVRDNRESVVGPYSFNNIIGPRRPEWDRSEMRVYN
jgi:hypothetical protein